jgi:hypothetical protein
MLYNKESTKVSNSQIISDGEIHCRNLKSSMLNYSLDLKWRSNWGLQGISQLKAQKTYQTVIFLKLFSGHNF